MCAIRVVAAGSRGVLAVDVACLRLLPQSCALAVSLCSGCIPVLYSCVAWRFMVYLCCLGLCRLQGYTKKSCVPSGKQHSAPGSSPPRSPSLSPPPLPLSLSLETQCS